MDLAFVNEDGEPVTIGDYIGLERPVILTLNYYRCPHLCKMTLNALVDGLRDIEWIPGQDFEIVTVSINPEEGPSLAKANKIGYLALYERPEAADGWHFLTGDEQNIRALADSVGFGYRYDEKSGEYIHSSTIIFLTPDGRVARYINDLTFPPETLRNALVESGEGTIGSFMERALIRCFLRYDPSRGEYAVTAEWIMYFGGIITVIALGAGLITAWRLDVRRQRRQSSHNNAEDDGADRPSATAGPEPLTNNH